MRLPLYEIPRMPPMPPDEERALIRRAQKGDQEARALLVTQFSAMISTIARQLVRKSRATWIKPADVENDGVVGFLEALALFDTTRPIRLSTYCHYWIRRRIQEALEKDERHSAKSLDGPIPTVANPFEQRTGTNLGDDSNPRSFHDMLGDDEPSVEEKALRDELMGRLRQHVDKLPMKHKWVILAVFGIGRPKLKLSQVASEMSVKPAVVSALLAEALASLRSSLRSMRD